MTQNDGNGTTFDVVKKKIAIVQTTMDLGGGTESVTAWTIQALKKDYDLTLITYSLVRIQELNHFYGTLLEEKEVKIIRPKLPIFLSMTRRCTFLKDHLMMRYCKSIKDDFDLFIGAGIGFDFGSPAMQYVGLGPASTLVKVLNRHPGSPYWYYWLKNCFILICQSISNFSKDNAQHNITLVNSDWTGKVVKETFKLPQYQVLYPPVESPPKKTPWEARADGFICIARIVPEKRIEEVIRIIRKVRESGFNLSLQIIGRPDNARYAEYIRNLANENSSWLTVQGVLPKDQLFPLMDQYKYGINGALDEPFGIAVAELVKAGCIVFTPNGGGQKEILKTTDLVFNDLEDGVQKIIQILQNKPMQRDILRHLSQQSEAFSTTAFCQGTQKIVSQYFNGE